MENSIDKEAFKGCEHILAMLPHQGQWHKNYVSTRVIRKREKNKIMHRYWYLKHKAERELVEKASTTSQHLIK
jgi:hypothetical protein